MTRIELQYVRVVMPARGGTYYYFDTGTRNAKGKRVFVRLPDPSDPKFGGAYAAAKGQRTRRLKAAEKPSYVTFPVLLRLFEKSPHYRKLAINTQRNYSRYLGAVAIRPDFAIAPASDLTRGDVRFVMDDLGDKPGAANVTLKAIGALYKWARDHEHVTINPTFEIEPFDSTPHEPWPEALLQAALADESVRLPVALLYYTAQRVGDVVNSVWSDIDGGFMRFKQEKTDTPLEIPVHRELASILATAPRRQLTILTNAPGTAPATRVRVYEWLTRFAAKQGYKVVPHGLRKNAVIALLEAGCSVAETASISGQSFQMVEFYAKARNQKKLASAAVLRWEKKA